MLLITGYEPFGEYEENPSGQIAQALDNDTIGGHEVVGRVLPVEFDRTAEEMQKLIDDHEPDAVIATGLSGRAGVSVERMGINVNDCGSTPDNVGQEPHNEPIDEQGADAHFATIPVEKITTRLLGAGIPAHLSNDAGTHLCNNVLYTTREFVEETDRELPVGFVHVPMTPAMAARQFQEGDNLSGTDVPPSMEFSRQVTATEIALETTADILAVTEAKPK